MSFADLIRQRVQAGLQGAEAQAGPFLDVLQELADGLTSDRIGAAITRGSVRGRFYLTLWPRTLPAKRCLMLAFWVTTRSIQVFVDPPLEFTDATSLRDWLADFVTSPAFLETLELLSESTQQPTEGYLRARRAGELTREDVIVEIAPEVQSALVEQDEGATVDITVTLASTIGAGTFDPQRSYVTLESSGIRVDEIHVELVHDSLLRVRGVKRSEPELRAELEAAAHRFDDFDNMLDEREKEIQRNGRP